MNDRDRKLLANETSLPFNAVSHAPQSYQEKIVIIFIMRWSECRPWKCLFIHSLTHSLIFIHIQIDSLHSSRTICDISSHRTAERFVGKIRFWMERRINKVQEGAAFSLYTYTTAQNVQCENPIWNLIQKFQLVLDFALSLLLSHSYARSLFLAPFILFTIHGSHLDVVSTHPLFMACQCIYV